MKPWFSCDVDEADPDFDPIQAQIDAETEIVEINREILEFEEEQAMEAYQEDSDAHE